MKLKPTQENLDKLQKILESLSRVADITEELMSVASGPSLTFFKAREALQNAKNQLEIKLDYEQ